jgi:ABC-type Mn2+/Zn2+ transport system ATPase subunit
VPACAKRRTHEPDHGREDQRPLRRPQVLRNVSLAIEPGEIVTIVGPNGSGKTSLLRAIIGAMEPVAGTVRRKPG